MNYGSNVPYPIVTNVPAPLPPRPAHYQKPGPNTTATMVSLYVRPVRRQVRDEFKAACARRGESIRSAVLKFMLDTIKADKENQLRIRETKKKKGK